MMYNWAKDRPDELTFCAWWTKSNWNINVLSSGNSDSVTAYVLPSVEAVKQKDETGIFKFWRFKKWQEWWALVIGSWDSIDMDVYQPNDLLLIGAVCTNSSCLGSITELIYLALTHLQSRPYWCLYWDCNRRFQI